MNSARVVVVHGHGRRQGLGPHLLDVVREDLRKREVETRVHDLLADGFDPSLRLEPDAPHAVACTQAEDPITHRYQRDVKWADRYLFLHPVWWFAPPAILKGWIDRVLVHDVALTQHESGPPTPLLEGRKALVVQTFNTLRAVDAVMFRNLSGAFWKRAVLPSVGIQDVKRLALYSVGEQGPEGIAKFEQRLRRAVARLVSD